MISPDQLDWLAYDQPGLLAELQLGYAILPWLDLQVGSTFGVFLSELDNGGLAAPSIGALARLWSGSVTPYAFADLGGAFTGALFLPMLRGGVGLEIQVSDSLRLGPTLSLGSVLYANDPGNSSDAYYVAIGLAGVYWNAPPRPQPRKLAERPPPRAAAPIVIREPTVEILKLVDRAVPARTDQVELLAPVLFAFDSDALEPVGVAMLHEVARFLAERTDLELVEIRAYADARGAADYNRELAGRRGQRVYDWLVEHGVDPARLTVAPVGSGEFVETEDAETAHEQNRRVVFRVRRIRGAE
jgi:outer membrane protein OmpA-like peptidoglycan-associated protein